MTRWTVLGTTWSHTVRAKEISLTQHGDLVFLGPEGEQIAVFKAEHWIGYLEVTALS